MTEQPSEDEPTVRYQEREAIPNFQHIVRTRAEHTRSAANHTKRGFIINPETNFDGWWTDDGRYRHITWKWARISDDCPLIIEFCFADEQTRDELHQITVEAFALWHNALGDRRGVHLEFTLEDKEGGVPSGICRQKSGKWGKKIPKDVVLIYNPRDSTREASGSGYLPGRKRGRIHIAFDPTNNLVEAPLHRFRDPHEAAVGAMAHELGMVHLSFR